MRKTYTLIVMLAMLFVGANSVSAQTSYTDDQGVVYSIDGTSAIITGYTGSATELTISQKFEYGEDSITVTGFGDYAFENKTDITKIVLTPKGFKPELGEGTFKGCTGLKTLKWVEGTYSTDNIVHLVNNVIPKYCFQGCTGITAIKSRYSNSTLKESAFKGCTNLSSAALGASCQNPASSAFSGCTYLATLTFGGSDPQYITEIADSVFFGCQFLKTIGKTDNVIALPKVTKIGSCAFFNCWKMATIQLPLVETISNQAFFNYFSNLQAFNLETVTGCENLTSLGQYAFYRCAKLKTIGSTENVVSLPKVYSIRAYAFKDCQSIETVKMNQSTGFYSYFYQDAFNGCTNLQRVITAKAVREVGIRAFSGASSLVGIGSSDTQSYVYLPYVTLLSTSAFENCTSMTSVYLNRADVTLATIGANAFKGCTNLETVVLQNMTPSALGTDAFSGLKSDAAFVLYPTNSYTKASNYANNDSWKVWFDDTNSSYKLVAYINKSNQYGTVSCDVPLHFRYTSTPAIYKVTATNDASAQLEEISSKKLPANTGAVMEKDLTFAGVQVQVLFDGSESADDFTGNLLVANVTENPDFVGNEGNTWNLILSNGKFVKATDGKLAAGLAYLPRTFEGGEAKELSLTFDDLTSIRTIDNVENTVDNGAWYTIDGTRLQGEPTMKGIYVRGGKKIVVK